MHYFQEHFPGSVGFPFVIPSEAEGSAFQWTSLGNVELRNKTQGAPHLARFSRYAPNFLHVALDKTESVPFFKERRIRFAEPVNIHRKSGMWDTTAFDLRALEPKQGRCFGHLAVESPGLAS
jgi:hypothetical protein